MGSKLASNSTGHVLAVWCSDCSLYYSFYHSLLQQFLTPTSALLLRGNNSYCYEGISLMVWKNLEFFVVGQINRGTWLCQKFVYSVSSGVFLFTSPTCAFTCDPPVVDSVTSLDVAIVFASSGANSLLTQVPRQRVGSSFFFHLSKNHSSIPSFSLSFTLFSKKKKILLVPIHDLMRSVVYVYLKLYFSSCFFTPYIT